MIAGRIWHEGGRLHIGLGHGGDLVIKGASLAKLIGVAISAWRRR